MRYIYNRPFRKVIFAALFIAALGGCSIHPLPNDVTSFDTYEIVKKIRCEARYAILDEAIQLLRSSSATQALKERTIASLRSHPEKWRDVDTRAFGEEVHRLVEKYDETAIVYDFTFTITEANNLSAELNLFRALSGGSDALGLKAGNNRMRQNLRNFRITDTFGGLLVAPLICPELAIDPNYIYPVIGNIGLSEVIHTFVRLNEDQNLTGKDELQASGVFKDKVPRFADTLTFTTTVSGSVGPKVVLNPVGKSFGLADAGLVAEANRTDVHAVVVALALPPQKRRLRFGIGSPAFHPRRGIARPASPPSGRPTIRSTRTDSSLSRAECPQSSGRFSEKQRQHRGSLDHTDFPAATM